MNAKAQSLILLTLFLASWNISFAHAQTDELNRLLNDMRSGDQEVRTKAMRSLVQRGKPAVPGLIQRLRDKDALVRASASNALGAIGDQNAVDELILILKDEHMEVRAVTAKGLGEIRDKRAVPQLITTLLTDHDWRVRMYAARALGQLQDERAVDPLLQHMKDKSKEEPERRVAILALGTLKPQRAKQALLDVLADSTEDYRLHTSAIAALGDIGDSGAEDALMESLHNSEPKIRYNSVVALSKLKARRAVAGLLRVFRNDRETEAIRIAAALALGEIGGEQATLALIEDLKLPDEYLAMYAARALGSIGDRRAIGAIKDLFRGSVDAYVKQQLQEVISRFPQ